MSGDLVGPFYVQVKVPGGKEYRIENVYVLRHGGVLINVPDESGAENVDGVLSWRLSPPISLGEGETDA